MKRIRLLPSLLVFFALLLGLICILGRTDPRAPRFDPLQTQDSATFSSYDFLAARPFERGKMSVGAILRGRQTNTFGYFIFDIDQRRVLGQLQNAAPVMLFGDPPQLLCITPASSMKQRLLKFLVVLSRGRVNLGPPPEAARYWVLNLDTGAARLVGVLPEEPRSRLDPSPDFHFCVAARTGRGLAEDLYLLDLRKASIRRLEIPVRWHGGWWDETRLLVRTANSDFALYDVLAKTIAPLIHQQQLTAFLSDNKLQEDPQRVGLFSIWNGAEYQFYLTDTHRKWAAEESALIKLERPDGKLRLLSPRFKFEWSDHLDPTGKHYLFSGREQGQASDGVFLRDCESATNRVLVPPTTNRYFSIPRFYQNSVIYVRSNALWQISLDGATNVRLFPPIRNQPSLPAP